MHATNHIENHPENCLFCDIVAGKIPCKKAFENDEFLAFHDIHPAALVHFLIVPKKHIASMAHVTADDASWLGRLMVLAPQLALEQGCVPYPEGGFRLQANTGAAGGQEVPHLHWHILGGGQKIR